MPFARIDLLEGKSPEFRRTVADVVYESMLHTLNAPQDDRFQVIARHDGAELIADATYLGVERSPDVVFIQLFLLAGRSVAQKQAFYRAVADGLHARLGHRREDVFIGLVEVGPQDWSFGNGVAQYV
jgi:4-oxalocrotonate tautomerase